MDWEKWLFWIAAALLLTTFISAIVVEMTGCGFDTSLFTTFGMDKQIKVIG
jgi:hypothetical protein